MFSPLFSYGGRSDRPFFFTAQGVFVAGMGGENFSKIAKKYILLWKKKNR